MSRSGSIPASAAEGITGTYVSFDLSFNTSIWTQQLSKKKMQYSRRYDASRASLNARLSCSLRLRGASREVLYIPQWAFARNIMSHFSYPKGDLQCQLVRLLVSGCAERPFVSAWLASGERRRLHQIFGGREIVSCRRERERERGRESLDLQCDQMGEREEIWVRRAVWTEMC